MSQYAEHKFFQGTQNNSWANMYRFIPDGARVLDIGCSTGNFGEALEHLKGATVTGIDLSETDIADARTKITEAFVMDATDPDALARLGTFDVVVLADVLEHVVEPRDLLAATRQLLKPDGVVVYSIPNMAHMSVRLDLLEGRFGYTETGLLDYTHLHFYDQREIADVFDSAGFVIAAESPVLSEYPRELVAKRLAAIGLTVEAGPRFTDAAESSHGNVYQFVGVARDDPAAAARPRTQRELILPTDEILEYARYFLDENEGLRKTDAHLLAIEDGRSQLREAQEQLRSAEEERDRLRAELLHIRQHPRELLIAGLKRRLRSLLP